MGSTYSQDDIQQILSLAISRQAKTEDCLSRTQLVEIADELGISPAELSQAEQCWQDQKGRQAQRALFDRDRQQRFQRKGTRYLIVNGFLVALDLLAGGGLGFSLYVIVGWGLGLAIAGQQTYGLQGEAYERKFQQWSRRRALKQSVDSWVNRLLPSHL